MATRPVFRRLVVGVLALTLLAPATPATAAPQDDARSGSDAGDVFAAATSISPKGLYSGSLDAASGDAHDFYRFSLAQGASISLLVTTNATTTDPIELLDPAGRVVDAGAGLASVGVSSSAVLTRDTDLDLGHVRLAVHYAAEAGEYRLHLGSVQFAMTSYYFCFMNCEGPRDEPIQFIFGGALRSPHTRVLLVPALHGDLGNPLGPTVLDYVGATMRGIHRWAAAMDAFAADYPEYGYLRDITVHVELFDGVAPVDPAGYDVIIGYVAAGPVFRGIAFDAAEGWTQELLDRVGLGGGVHFSGRLIGLSLYSSSPRAGQVLYDFPEVNDLEIVTTHEFGHTFGLGHTLTWDGVLGPDLMNSPAPFVYGDGFPAGDGGERTAMKCLSSLDLYGMAVLYRWLPDGEWTGTNDEATLPEHIPYRWYC